MKGDDIASFFVKDLGLALAPKMCPDQSQALKDVNSCQAFTVGNMYIYIFWTSRFQLLQGMLVQSLAQIFEELNIILKLTPEIEHTLKASNYDAKP